MICPMLSSREEAFTKCQRAKCAWWSKENKACAVKVIAENGGICCQPYGDYAGLLPTIEDDETDMPDRGNS